MTKRFGFGYGTLAIALLAIVGLSRDGTTQPAAGPQTITVGIYAPTVPFAGSQARLQYIAALGRAIQQNTGVQVKTLSFTSYAQLRGRKVDFAVVDGQCYATKRTGTLLANAKVGGSTTRRWALYSSQGNSFAALKGKKIAYVKTGCNDTGFLQNAMLSSEVNINTFFSGKVGSPDVAASVAAVASRRSAHAVFAPLGKGRGLTKVFDAASVPNPAFVQFNKKLAKSLSSKVRRAVTSFGGGGAISGWSGAKAGDYKSLRGRMGRRVKRGVLSAPSIVGFNVKDVLIKPKTLNDTDLTDVSQHFEAPPERLE